MATFCVVRLGKMETPIPAELIATVYASEAYTYKEIMDKDYCLGSSIIEPVYCTKALVKLLLLNEGSVHEIPWPQVKLRDSLEDALTYCEVR